MIFDIQFALTTQDIIKQIPAGIGNDVEEQLAAIGRFSEQLDFGPHRNPVLGRGHAITGIQFLNLDQVFQLFLQRIGFEQLKKGKAG